MVEHYYCILKTGEYIHIGDEILINDNWEVISKYDFLNKKYCDYFVMNDCPRIRRCHPESLENIEESIRAMNIIIRRIRERA